MCAPSPSLQKNESWKVWWMTHWQMFTTEEVQALIYMARVYQHIVVFFMPYFLPGKGPFGQFHPQTSSCWVWSYLSSLFLKNTNRKQRKAKERRQTVHDFSLNQVESIKLIWSEHTIQSTNQMNSRALQLIIKAEHREELCSAAVFLCQCVANKHSMQQTNMNTQRSTTIVTLFNSLYLFPMLHNRQTPYCGTLWHWPTGVWLRAQYGQE